MSAKLHIGSGTIYLQGYVNVDVPSPRCFLSAQRPDLVEAYATSEAHYYARHDDHKAIQSFRGGPEAALYVCDRYGSWFALPCRDGDAEEILSRGVFEHLSETEAHVALREAHRVLAPEGLLRLSVPDHEATLDLFIKTGDPLYVRFLLGPRGDGAGYHMKSYTRVALLTLVESHGFVFERDELNPHAYPMHCVAWKKPA